VTLITDGSQIVQVIEQIRIAVVGGAVVDMRMAPDDALSTVCLGAAIEITPQDLEAEKLPSFGVV
jgi:hypothetical protein